MAEPSSRSIIIPLVALYVSGLYSTTKFRLQFVAGGKEYLGWLLDVFIGLIVYCVLESLTHNNQAISIVPFWSLSTSLTSRLWPQLVLRINTQSRSSVLRLVIHGGPLGHGCKKVVEVVVAMCLWKITNKSWPSIQLLHPLPTWREWLCLLIFSFGVNSVLQLWSTTMKSRGNHLGVNDMVQSTRGRNLSISEHVQIFLLALVNGSCEEITSRYFWRQEFAAFLLEDNGLNSDDEFTWTHISYSNLAQAWLFGLWHYYGIPSGWTGVLLTFVYGYTMGIIQDYAHGGLFLACITHGIADYYIFAIIARRNKLSKE